MNQMGKRKDGSLKCSRGTTRIAGHYEKVASIETSLPYKYVTYVQLCCIFSTKIR